MPNPNSIPTGEARLLSRSLNLLVVDPHPITRAATVREIAHLTRQGSARGAETAAKALSSLALIPPDLIVTEVSLNGPSGLDFIRQVTGIARSAVVLVFSGAPEVWYADRAIRAGARGYVMKSAPPSVLLKAVEKVMRGGGPR